MRRSLEAVARLQVFWSLDPSTVLGTARGDVLAHAAIGHVRGQRRDSEVGTGGQAFGVGTRVLSCMLPAARCGREGVAR